MPTFCEYLMKRLMNISVCGVDNFCCDYIARSLFTVSSFYHMSRHTGFLSRNVFTQELRVSVLLIIAWVRVVKHYPPLKSRRSPWTFTLCSHRYIPLSLCGDTSVVDFWLIWAECVPMPLSYLVILVKPGYTEWNLKKNFLRFMEMRRHYAPCLLACATWSKKRLMPPRTFATLVQAYMHFTSHKVAVPGIISVW